VTPPSPSVNDNPVAQIAGKGWSDETIKKHAADLDKPHGANPVQSAHTGPYDPDCAAMLMVLEREGGGREDDH